MHKTTKILKVNSIKMTSSISREDSAFEKSENNRDVGIQAYQDTELTEGFLDDPKMIEKIKRGLTMDYYKECLLKFSMYSPESCRTLHKTIASAQTLSDLYHAESPLMFRFQRRTEQEAQFFQSWLSIYDLPQPHNNYEMPKVWPTPLGDTRKHIANKTTYLLRTLIRYFSIKNNHVPANN